MSTLGNLFGTRLLLWIGFTRPTPAPLAMQDAFEQAEVYDDRDHGGAFRLTFRLTKTQLGEFDLLLKPQTFPGVRVILGIVDGVLPRILIDGFVSQRTLTPGEKAGESVLTLTGRDLGSLLDRVVIQMAYPGSSSAQIATTILARYSMWGLIPSVIPTLDIPSPLEGARVQNETDYQCLRRLARGNGYVFLIQPQTLFVNVAYFGPEPRIGLPQSVLRVGSGPQTNVQSLVFEHDPDAAEMVGGYVFVPATAVSAPVPPAPAVGKVPLAMLPDVPRRARMLPETVKYNPARAAVAMQAKALESSETLHAHGRLDVMRYGRVLRNNQLVSVAGAGLAFDGFYYTTSVTHEISRKSYTQSFTLAREGSYLLSPVVTP